MTAGAQRTVVIASTVATTATVSRFLATDIDQVPRTLVGGWGMAIGLLLLSEIMPKAAAGLAVIAAMTALTLAADSIEDLVRRALDRPGQAISSASG